MTLIERTPLWNFPFIIHRVGARNDMSKDPDNVDTASLRLRTSAGRDELKFNRK